MTLARQWTLSAAAALVSGLSVACPSAALADQSKTRYRTYVDGPWGQIHLRVDGAGPGYESTIILLHQMVWSSLQFEHVQPLLAKQGVRSVAVDLPGYGLSDGPAHVPTAAEYAGTLLPILDHFGLSKAILHGNHTGATIVAAFADGHPDRVDRLILQGPPIFDPQTRRALLAEKPFDQTPQADGSHLLGRWQQASASFGADTSLASRHRSVLEFFTAGPREWYAHDAVFRYDLKAVVQRLAGPVLLLSNPGDSLYDAALHVKALRPDFDYVELAWRGAHAIYDDPQTWANAVTAYVKMPDVTPAVQAFWAACSDRITEPPVDGFYRVRHFGANPDTASLLLRLIVEGEKTVTFPIPWVYQGNPNATPVVGGYTVVTDFNGNPGALLRTTSVKTLPFNEVTEADTQYEGPGARPLAAWRQIHWDSYTLALKPKGKAPAEDMPVTVERFELVCTAAE